MSDRDYIKDSVADANEKARDLALSEAQNQIYIDALQAICRHLEMMGGGGAIKPTTLVIAERAIIKAWNVRYDWTQIPPKLVIPE